MKIFQFTPNALAKTTQQTGGGKNTEAPGKDFASYLKKASSPQSPSALPESGQNVIMENLRALQLPSLNDLGQAGRLLGRLDSDIRAATPEALRNVHNLEGIIHIYSKAGE